VISASACDALFCSPLQPSEFPNGSVIRCAITDTLARLGGVECAARVAQEFGDHPELSQARMEWVLWSVSWVYLPARV
jgi:hypothetical protein